MSWDHYINLHKGRPVRPLYLKAIEILAEINPVTGTAIDIGCGAGVEAADLANRGWNVVAMDREPAAMAAVLELVSGQNKGKLRTICSSFENLTDLPSAEFIYSYHSLSFCRADHLDRIWSLICSSLKPKGIFAGSFFGPNDDWVRSGATTGVSRDHLDQYFEKFELLHLSEFNEVGNTALGGPKHWHFYEVIGSKRT